jgi:hypothetical protein
VAASFVPSLLEAIDRQSREPTLVCSVQVVPELAEVQIYPSWATAASFVPSLDDAIDIQAWVPAEVCSIQVAPESVDV